jgi:hypothetical protein
MKKLLVAGLALALLAGVAVVAQPLGAQDEEESFVAVLRGRGNIAAGMNTRIEIYIERWSEPGERERLLGIMAESGSQALVQALQEVQPVGRVRVGTRTSWPLSYSNQIVNADGSRTIRLATDRPISGLEALNSSSTMKHAFSLFEMQLDANGEGSGTVVAGARITINAEARTFGIESYDSAPLELVSIRPGR